MEGVLSKWGGFMSGWSEKYFVLHKGILTVFASQCCLSDTTTETLRQEKFRNQCWFMQGERKKGDPAKDHLNMGVCEIVVDANDHLQWELRVPMESKVWCLKASTTSDRQKWIKALGSAKACMLDTSTLEYLPLPSHNPILEQETSQSALEDHIANCSIGGVSTDATLLDLTASNNFDTDERNSGFGDGSMNNLLLSSINNEDGDPNSTHSVLLSKCDSAKASITLLENALVRSSEENVEEILAITEQATRELLQAICSASFETTSLNTHDVKPPPLKPEAKQNPNKKETVVSDAEIDQFATFFTESDVSFHDVATKFVTKDDKVLIPIEEFLRACQYYVGFFDRFAGTVLSPLRSDIHGNILKIRKASEAPPNKCTYLQELVDYEISKKQHTGSNTGTQALIWLTRSLRVMSGFLDNNLKSSSTTWKEPAMSLWTSYNKFLAKHHNWMVQRLFKVGLKLLPDFDAFCHSMSAELVPGDTDVLYSLITRDGLKYSAEMSVVVVHLIEFFSSRKLEV